MDLFPRARTQPYYHLRELNSSHIREGQLEPSPRALVRAISLLDLVTVSHYVEPAYVTTMMMFASSLKWKSLLSIIPWYGICRLVLSKA